MPPSCCSLPSPVPLPGPLPSMPSKTVNTGRCFSWDSDGRRNGVGFLPFSNVGVANEEEEEHEAGPQDCRLISTW
eukprot:3940896-Rhodomonas_salina.3